MDSLGPEPERPDIRTVTRRMSFAVIIFLCNNFFMTEADMRKPDWISRIESPEAKTISFASTEFYSTVGPDTIVIIVGYKFCSSQRVSEFFRTTFSGVDKSSSCYYPNKNRK